MAIKNMGGECEAAWRTLLDDLVNRGLETPRLAIIEGLSALNPVYVIEGASIVAPLAVLTDRGFAWLEYFSRDFG